MSDEIFVAEKLIYSCRLKNRMLCKYMEIIEHYGGGVDSELAKDLEELIQYAKDCGKDNGFRTGTIYADLLLNEYIDFS